MSGCSLDQSELARLVTLELTGVLDASDRTAHYQVQVSCETTSVLIQLDDPLSRKGVQRRVVAPAADQPEPERVIALTVAQLYRAAWLELASADSAPLPPTSPKAPAPTIAAARAVAARKLAWRFEPAWSLGLAGGVRWRHLPAPFMMPHGELRVLNLATPPLLLSASLSMEAASIERRRGMVSSRLLGGGFGAGLELFRRRRWFAFSELSVGLAHVQLQGTDVAASYDAGAISSLGVEGSVGLGLGWSGRSVRVELASRAGVLSGTPVGVVDPDGDVTLNGPWLGAELRFGVLR